MKKGEHVNLSCSFCGKAGAKSKPIEEHTPASLGVDMTPRLTVTKVALPPARKAGIKVPDVATLVEKLKTEAKAL